MTDPDDRNTEVIEIFDHLSELDPDCGEYTDEDIYWQSHADNMEDK